MTPEERLSPQRVAVLSRRARLVACGVGVPVAVVLVGVAAYAGDVTFVVVGPGAGLFLGGLAAALTLMPTQLDTLRWSFTVPGLERRRARRAVRAMRRNRPDLVAADDLPVLVRSAEVRLRIGRLLWPTWVALGGAALVQVPVLLGLEPAPVWHRVAAVLPCLLVPLAVAAARSERRSLERFLAAQGVRGGPG